MGYRSGRALILVLVFFLTFTTVFASDLEKLILDIPNKYSDVQQLSCE